MSHLANQRNKILEILEKDWYITLPELMRIAAQYNARIFELRARGYVITCNREYVQKNWNLQMRTFYTLDELQQEESKILSLF